MAFQTVAVNPRGMLDIRERNVQLRCLEPTVGRPTDRHERQRDLATDEAASAAGSLRSRAPISPSATAQRARFDLWGD